MDIIKNHEYGYRFVYPIPEDSEISSFYKKKYYKVSKAPDLIKEEETLSWLISTLYSDIYTILKENAVGNRVLDVGCGGGDMLVFLKDKGFNVTGVEVSDCACGITRSKGCTVYKEIPNKDKFDVVLLLNVLEHVTNPTTLISDVKRVLAPGGILCVLVPNDFSRLQSLSQKILKKKPWWVSIPDHLNYFNFTSLNTILEKSGFNIIYTQGDFPIELFLLAGLDYTNNNDIGMWCHKQRMRFELFLPNRLRRKIYETLALISIGRSCLTFGVLEK